MVERTSDRWELAEAGEKLHAIWQRSITHGPQELTVAGTAVVAVVSILELRQLLQQQTTFKEFLLSFPSLEGLDPARDRTPARDVEL